jgi:single-stranded DNA-binding protein
MFINSISISGRTTKNYEPPYITKKEDGREVSRFHISIAQNIKINGEYQPRFYDLVLFGKAANSLYSLLEADKQKSFYLIVSGKLEQRSYISKNEEKKIAYSILVDHFSLCETLNKEKSTDIPF